MVETHQSESTELQELKNEVLRLRRKVDWISAHRSGGHSASIFFRSLRRTAWLISALSGVCVFCVRAMRDTPGASEATTITMVDILTIFIRDGPAAAASEMLALRSRVARRAAEAFVGPPLVLLVAAVLLHRVVAQHFASALAVLGSVVCIASPSPPCPRLNLLNSGVHVLLLAAHVWAFTARIPAIRSF